MSAKLTKDKEQIRVHVRWMIRRDMKEVLHTELLAGGLHWDEEEFLRTLRQRNSIGMIAEHGEQVIGHMVYELHKYRLNIVNFAVHPAWQRRGVGVAMAETMVKKLSSHRRTRLTADVPEQCLSMQLFLRAMKFEAVKVNHMLDGDTYRMVYSLSDAVDEEGTIDRCNSFLEE